MPTRKGTAKSPRTERSSGHAPGASDVLGGVLQRMGEVLGPGAIYSLVHYGALEEGTRLGAQHTPEDSAAVVQLIAEFLGIEARITTDQGNRMSVLVKGGPRFSMEDRVSVALVVGLLEGALSTARRRKMQVTAEPGLGRDGTLELEFAG